MVDFLIKPLQGSVLKRLRGSIMGNTPFQVEERVESKKNMREVTTEHKAISQNSIKNTRMHIFKKKEI